MYERKEMQKKRYPVVTDRERDEYFAKLVNYIADEPLIEIGNGTSIQANKLYNMFIGECNIQPESISKNRLFPRLMEDYMDTFNKANDGVLYLYCVKYKQKMTYVGMGMVEASIMNLKLSDEEREEEKEEIREGIQYLSERLNQLKTRHMKAL